MTVLRTIFLSLSLSLLWSGAVYAADDLDTYPGGEFYPEMMAEEESFKLSDIRIPDVDHYLYPEPEVPIPHTGDNLKSCMVLDDEIVDLMPLTYRTVPDFYDDPKVGAAIFLTTLGISLTDLFPENLYETNIPLGYALLAYPEYKKYKEDERIRRVSFRIESLRRSKARKHCYET